MVTRSMIVMGVLATAMLVGGCNKDNVQAPQSVRSDPLAGGYPQNIALKGLHNGVVIGKPIVDAATDDQPMRVTVPLRSVADGTLRTQYKFTFLDGRGRPVRSNTNTWRYQVLAAKAEVFLEATSLDTDAADWRLEVRPAQ